MDAVGSNIRVDTYGVERKEYYLCLMKILMKSGYQIKQGGMHGLLNQRLDTPYIKKNNKLEQVSWEETFLNKKTCYGLRSDELRFCR